VIPPGEGGRWAAAYYEQIFLVFVLVIIRTIIGSVEWVLHLFDKKRERNLSPQAKLMLEMSKSIASRYNMGDEAKSTGVAFDDVQARCCLFPLRWPLRICHPASVRLKGIDALAASSLAC
jgi:hypothetical protein